MDPLIVSFYTKDSLYEEEIRDLILSCEALKLEYSINGVVSLGSWEKNCCYKPKFLLEKLLVYKKPLLWIDADAIIIKKPFIDNFLQYDFGFRFKYDEKDKKQGIRSGTIFINYSEESIEFLKKWDQECQKELNNPKRTYEVWDQNCLYKLIDQYNYKIKFCELPVSYCRIFDKSEDKEEDENIYILQFQASRLYKTLINNNIEVPEFLKNLDFFELKKIRYKK